MKAHEIQLASVSKKLVGENLAGEVTPFYEATKAGLDILTALHVFVSDLTEKTNLCPCT